jgi:hypothetical protein
MLDPMIVLTAFRSIAVATILVGAMLAACGMIADMAR